MADKTGIEWTDATWNPVTGCAKVSAGCKNCYALRDWRRLSAMPGTVYHGREFTDVACHPERLEQPMRWARPRRIFVNSMSDLFHPAVPDAFIAKVFAVMALCSRHTFQVLTKRPERMHDMVCRLPELVELVPDSLQPADSDIRPRGNVWLGVSVEDQKAADERIPLLLATPAAVRWISAEPLLGPVDLSTISHTASPGYFGDALEWHHRPHANRHDKWPGLDWVVVGGESGQNARPMHPAWASSLRDQCAAAGVPFLFKQWGEWYPASSGHSGPVGAWHGDTFMPDWGDISTSENNMVRAGKKAKDGRLLDGRTHDGYPDSAA